MMRVHGSNYSDRVRMCCVECRRTVKDLQHAHMDYILRACGAHSCVALLCTYCGSTHKAMHELAGDRVWDWWSKSSARERREYEKKREKI